MFKQLRNKEWFIQANRGNQIMNNHLFTVVFYWMRTDRVKFNYFWAENLLKNE